MSATTNFFATCHNMSAQGQPDNQTTVDQLTAEPSLIDTYLKEGRVENVASLFTTVNGINTIQKHLGDDPSLYKIPHIIRLHQSLESHHRSLVGTFLSATNTDSDSLFLSLTGRCTPIAMSAVQRLLSLSQLVRLRHLTRTASAIGLDKEQFSEFCQKWRHITDLLRHVSSHVHDMVQGAYSATRRFINGDGSSLSRTTVFDMIPILVNLSLHTAFFWSDCSAEYEEPLALPTPVQRAIVEEVVTHLVTRLVDAGLSMYRPAQEPWTNGPFGLMMRQKYLRGVMMEGIRTAAAEAKSE